MFLSTQELVEGLHSILQSPRLEGTVELIVRRPEVGGREEVSEGELSLELGLMGDNWSARGYKKTADGSAHPDVQINLMNARVISLIARSRSRWKLAGDQFYVDLDLSKENLPPGTKLKIGDAVIEITAEPHLGCKKFIERFGRDAALFVNSERGKQLNLRGVNAKVIKAGSVGVGDVIGKLAAE